MFQKNDIFYRTWEGNEQLEMAHGSLSDALKKTLILVDGKHQLYELEALKQSQRNVKILKALGYIDLKASEIASSMTIKQPAHPIEVSRELRIVVNKWIASVGIWGWIIRWRAVKASNINDLKPIIKNLGSAIRQSNGEIKYRQFRKEINLVVPQELLPHPNTQ